MSYAKKPTSISNNQKELFSSILDIGYQVQACKDIERLKPTKTTIEKNKKMNKALSEVKIQLPEPKVQAEKTNNPKPNENTNNNKTSDDEEICRKINLTQNPNDIDPSSYLIAYQNRMKNKLFSNPPEFLNSPTYNSSPSNLLKRLKQPEDELAFIKENNEWAAINKYQLYKEKKEKEMKKQNYLQEMDILNSFIDNQLKQKKERLKLKTQEDYQYVDFIKEKMKKEEQKELEMKEIKKQKKKIERVLRDTELKEKVTKKKALKKEQREFEEKLLPSYPPNIRGDKEKKLESQKKEKEISELYFDEGLKKIKNKLDARENEKEENLQYQKNYARELEEKEAARKAFIKERFEDVKNKNQAAANYDKAALEPNKYQKIFDGFAKSEERHKRILAENKESEKLKRNNDFHSLKTTLEEQIMLKKSQDELHKKKYDDQQAMWQQDNAIYNELERRKKEEKLKMRQEWAEELRKQIEEREAMKKKQKNNMSAEEGLLNKALLDELKSFKESHAPKF